MIIFHVFAISSFVHIYKERERHISPLIPFSTINIISISVKIGNFNFVFFKAAWHANPGTQRNFAGSTSYISRHKFPNTAGNNEVSL